jgi:hypothetical protein
MRCPRRSNGQSGATSTPEAVCEFEPGGTHTDVTVAGVELASHSDEA